MIKGKKLEGEVRDYLKENGIWHHKYNDSFSSRGFVTPVPADFEIWPTKGPHILLECKMSEKERIPLSAFRPAQFAAMRQSLKVESCNYYVLICYDKNYYLIGAETILDYLEAEEKSIHLFDSYLAISSINNAMDTLMLDNSGEL